MKDDRYCEVFGHKIKIETPSTGSVWIDGGTRFCGLFDAEITDREWIESYKNKLHPNDDWTNVNIETYGRWIKEINYAEGNKLVNDALKAHVVGYLD